MNITQKTVFFFLTWNLLNQPKYSLNLSLSQSCRFYATFINFVHFLHFKWSMTFSSSRNYNFLVLHLGHLISGHFALYDIKRGVFKWVFFYVKVLPRSCLPDIFFSLMRPLKWGTAWSSISRGIGNTSSQTFDYPSLLNKVGLFWNFWLSPAVILRPFEIEFFAVSHFKDLINCKNISDKQERSNTFT